MFAQHNRQHNGRQHQPHWGYSGEYGPERWIKLAPAAKGLHQSPVDVVTKEVVRDQWLDLSPIRTHYVPASCRCLQNTGHGVQIDVDDSDAGRGLYLMSWMEGGPYRHRYRLQQFHFHWGKTNDSGSEHLIDSKGFAAELHLVHWNIDLYSSFAEAAKSAGGLAVLCVFIKVGKEHRFLSKITDLLPNIAYSGDVVPMKGGFDPTTLLPVDRSRYYTYTGSLTTPPCYESVRFLMFSSPIQISQKQLDAFRQLHTTKRGEWLEAHDEFRGKMLCNCRPVQPLNDRKILASFS